MTDQSSRNSRPTGLPPSNEPSAKEPAAASQLINYWPTEQYELVDFGAGRKLERFGRYILDRPSPAAVEHKKALPDCWSLADYRLEEHAGAQNAALAPSNEWLVQFGAAVFSLRITPFGHVGLFPEHASHWNWLSQLEPVGTDKNFLNLFAYTGGGSLVMAAQGWQVVHVDSSSPTVAWARENARLSGLSTAPIRWLVEDARSFVAREIRRQRIYQLILLDPPSYGHGPKGKAWQLERDLPALLDDCCRLLAPGGWLMLTGHTALPALQTLDLPARLMRAGMRAEPQTGRTRLVDRTGRELDFGWFYRVQARSAATSAAE